MLVNFKTAILNFLVVALTAFSFSAQAAGDGLSGYEIGSGDLLSIQVFGEEGLSIESRLSDAGTISYPFLGEIEAKGMSIGELSEYVRVRLADGYLVNPSVNVSVLEYREFFINGEVAEPGAYPYQPGLTLQKAVALAGGFTERASSSKMFVVRDGNESAKPARIALNASIKPGDIITVEESFF